MSQNCLKSKFLDQLNNGEVSLERRLYLAKGALVSQSFPLPNKEQVVLDWFASCLQNHRLDSSQILKMIKSALSHNQLSAFCDPIDPSKLIEVLLQISDGQKNKDNKLIVACLVMLLQNPGFRRFCRFEVQPMCQASILALHLIDQLLPVKGSLSDSKYVTDNEMVDTELGKILDSIHNIYKVTQQRSELQLFFVSVLLPTLLTLKFSLDKCSTLRTLFEELVVKEEWTLVCEAFKEESQRKIHLHLKSLADLVTNSEKQSELVTLNSLLLDVYLESCLSHSKQQPNPLAMFYILMSVAGFHLELPYTTVATCHLNDLQQLAVLKELVSVLQKHNIPVSTETEEGTLSTHLECIEKMLLSGKYNLSPMLLRTLQIVFNVYPESVRLIFTEFAQQIIFVEKHDSKIIKHYNNLLITVIKAFSDLNQLNKFYALFSHKCALAEKENRLEKLTIDMILTSGVFTVLSEKVPSLTGNQLKIIIGRMEKTLAKDLVPVLETNNVPDTRLKLYIKISMKLLCHLLENGFFVAQTRWNIIGEEIKSLALTVRRFGVAVSNSFEEDLLLAFLQLVRVLVDLEIMLNHYTISHAKERFIPGIESEQDCCGVHNLNSTHGFLSPLDWQQVWDVVKDTPNYQLRQCWWELLLQKYTRLRDQAVVVLLAINAEGEWLWDSLTRLAKCVPTNHLELYVDRLLDPETLSAGNLSDKLSALADIEVFTNRPLRAVLNLAVLRHLSASLPDKRSLSRNMVKLIDVSSVVQFEAAYIPDEEGSNLVVLAKGLTEMINICQWEENPPAIRQTSKDYLFKLLDLITVLRPHCLKVKVKKIICLTLMGIAYDMREDDSIVHSVLETLLGCLGDRSSIFPNTLDNRVVVMWLARAVPRHFPHHHQLTNLVVTKMVHRLDQCTSDLCDAVKEDPQIFSAVLESLIQVHGNKALKNRKDFLELVKKLISTASLFAEKEIDAFLPLYTLALKAECVFFKNQTPRLIVNLSNFLHILLRRFEENSVVEPSTAELIDLTLSLKPHLGAGVLEQVTQALTKELCKVDCCPLLCYPTTVRAFLEALSPQDFERTMNEISLHQLKALERTMSNVCELWGVVVSAHLDRDKAKMRQQLLTATLGQCHSVIEEEPSRTRPALVRLLHTISLSSKSIVLTDKLVDYILVILGEVPSDTQPELLPDCLSSLDSLIHVRSKLIFDRIPAYLQRLRQFMKSLVTLASRETVDFLAFNNISTASVNHITRIVKTIRDHHAKHFARISPYMIADMLHYLATYPIHSSVKNELQNCVCLLLAVCDHRGTQLLQSLLPLPSTELFKVIIATYTKSYKYTGKV